MGLVGGDPEGMRQCASIFEQEAGNVESTISAVDSAVSGVEWIGTDRDNFEQQWQSETRTALQQAAEMLQTGSTTLNSNAEAQEATSSSL